MGDFIYPIIDIDEVKGYWNLFQKSEFPYYAFLLYTEEDQNLAWYIRKHFLDIDALSGCHCLLFLIDDPHDSSYWEDPYFSERLKFSPELCQ